VEFDGVRFGSGSWPGPGGGDDTSTVPRRAHYKRREGSVTAAHRPIYGCSNWAI
jgi:hypothetical protein